MKTFSVNSLIDNERALKKSSNPRRRVSVGSGYASEAEGGTIANTQFTSIPGVAAQAPAQGATARNGQVVQAYVTQSGRSTWLFPPNENGNG